MPAERNRPKRENFNQQAQLPFQLRLEDFEIAMQDVYDLFYDVNSGLLEKGFLSGRARLDSDRAQFRYSCPRDIEISRVLFNPNTRISNRLRSCQG
jgi:hypothetical protein